MTGRDRIVVTVIVALGILAGVWFMAVAPKREQAAKLASEVAAAQGALASAESQVANASAAQARYQNAYASIVRLGKAVPASQEVPALIYQLAQATDQKNVEFASISATVPGAAGGASSPASLATATAGAGFTQMPFTFTFNGGFENLYSLFQQLDGFTTRNASGDLSVSGRLLTIQSIKLAPVGSGAGATGSGASGGSKQLSGTITATAYVLPAGQSLTGGATPAGPTGTATQTVSTGATSSANAPAVVQVNP
jgi:hypothetical protein